LDSLHQTRAGLPIKKTVSNEVSNYVNVSKISPSLTMKKKSGWPPFNHLKSRAIKSAALLAEAIQPAVSFGRTACGR
jgi:hypothetical protein